MSPTSINALFLPNQLFLVKNINFTSHFYHAMKYFHILRDISNRVKHILKRRQL